MSSGDYVWNAGIFAVKASVYLEELAAFEPEISAQLERAWAEAQDQSRREGIPRLAFRAVSFGAIEKKSIDYAIMERTQRGGCRAG